MTLRYASQGTGLDTNSGLRPDDAWQTLAKVNASHLAGDEVITKPGDAWLESMIPKASTLVRTGFEWPGVSANAPRSRFAPASAVPAFKVLSVNDVIGQDLELDGTGGTASPCSIDNSNGTIIRGCEAHHAPAGQNCISLLTGGVGVRIFNNNCHDSLSDCINGHGTHVGFVISFNKTRKSGNGLYDGGASGDGISFHDDCEGDIAFNNCRQHEKGGIINVQNAGKLIRVYGNFVCDSARFPIAQESAGSMDAWANIVVIPDCSAANGALPAATNITGIGGYLAAHMRVYHNTVFNPVNNTNYFCFGTGQGDETAVYWEGQGNLAYVVPALVGRCLNIGRTDLWNTTLWDKNAYHPGQTASRFRWKTLAVASAGTLSVYQLATGIEPNSISVDPLFVGEAAGLLVNPGLYPTNLCRLQPSDFRLRAESTLLAGVPIFGNSFDIDFMGCQRGLYGRATTSYGAYMHSLRTLAMMGVAPQPMGTY